MEVEAMEVELHLQLEGLAMVESVTQRVSRPPHHRITVEVMKVRRNFHNKFPHLDIESKLKSMLTQVA